MAYSAKKVDVFTLHDELQETTDTLIEVLKVDNGYIIITEDSE
jgi:hypothetical protein